MSYCFSSTNLRLAFSDIVPTRVAERPKVGESVLLNVTGRKVVCLKLVLNASISSCRSIWRRLSSEVNEKEGLDEDDILDAASLKLLLQRDAVWTQNFVLLIPS